MADLLLATVAALIAGGCTLALAVIVARVIRDGRVYPDARDAVRAALAAEAGEWEPYRCECGELVTRPEDERVAGLARERVCIGCYVGSQDHAHALRDRRDDLRLHALLDDGGVR